MRVCVSFLQELLKSASSFHISPAMPMMKTISSYIHTHIHHHHHHHHHHHETNSATPPTTNTTTTTSTNTTDLDFILLRAKKALKAEDGSGLLSFLSPFLGMSSYSLFCKSFKSIGMYCMYVCMYVCVWVYWGDGNKICMYVHVSMYVCANRTILRCPY